jgi:small-conductance mechanosensitive channel
MSHFQVERDYRNELKKLFEANDIEIPFPQIVVSQK